MINKDQLQELANTLGGIPILSCMPGSVSARAGIRYGDVVLAINGMKTPDMEAYLEARQLRTDGLNVELFRDGETITVELIFEEKVNLSEDNLKAMAQDVVASRIFSEEDTFASVPKKVLN